MAVVKRGPRTKVGGITYLPRVIATKSIRDEHGVDHEVLFRSKTFDGRYSYMVRCRYALPTDRRRWKDEPTTCLDCIANIYGVE